MTTGSDDSIFGLRTGRGKSRRRSGKSRRRSSRGGGAGFSSNPPPPPPPPPPRPPIFNAIRDGDLELVESLLGKGNDVVNEVYVSEVLGKNVEQTPLMVAILMDEMQILQLLIDDGADVNKVTRNYDGNNLTPLGMAYRMNNDKAAQILLRSGAIRGKLLPNEEEEFYDKNQRIQSNPPPPPPRPPIFKAIRDGDLELVESLLGKGNDVVNEVYVSEVLGKNVEQTPLMVAIVMDKMQILQLLIDYGADVNKVTRNYEGNNITPLSVAYRMNNNKAAQILLSYGAIR